MKPELRNVLFDLDGTLTDSAEGMIGCLRFTMERMGREAPEPEELAWCLGPPFREVLTTLLKSGDDVLLEKAAAICRGRFTEKGIFENRLYPGVAQGLEQMQRAGLRLFVATSKLRRHAEMILNNLGLADFFQAINGREEDGRFEDKADLVAHIIEWNGLAKAETIMVGDRVHDVRAGRANQIQTALVAYGYADEEETISCQPDYLFDSMNDLAVFLIDHARAQNNADAGAQTGMK